VVVKPVDVNCMACLVTGVDTPIGWRDPLGIVHRVRWRTRGGCYKLCDFRDDAKMRDGARPIDVDALISVEEP
jgi:hypothetical protein